MFHVKHSKFAFAIVKHHIKISHKQLFKPQIVENLFKMWKNEFCV